MKQRPRAIGPLVEALSKAGADFNYLGGDGYLSLSIATTGLPGGTLYLDAPSPPSTSPPSSSAQQDTTLVLTGDMTIEFTGIHVVRERDPETCAECTPSLNPASSPLNRMRRARRTDCPRHHWYQLHARFDRFVVPPGDARFAKEILELMRCTVVLTVTETTVTAPPTGPVGCVAAPWVWTV